MFPEDVGKDEVSFQQDTKKLLSHVRLGLAVKEKTKTEIIRDSVTKPQLLATPKFSELLNVYDAQQEIIHAKDPRSLFAKLNKYIVTLVLASEVEGVKFESADHDLVKESLAFMQKYMRAEKFKMTTQDINKIVSEELYRRDGKLTVTYNIKLPKMDDKAITKSASEMSSKNTIRFIHFIDAVIERNQDAAFMLTDTSQDDMDNPYLAIIQAHIDYLNCIKNLSLALDTTLDYMTSVPERNAILRNILIHIHSGADSVELLEKALNAFPELEQLKKQRLLTTLAPHIKDIIASKLLVEKKKKSCFKMEDLPEKIQARAAILTSLGVNLLAVDDLLHDDKIQRENERSRLKSFFVPDSGSDKKDSAMESQIINLLIGGRFSPLSVDQKLTRSINTDELIASLVPIYSALANLYHSATTVAGSAFDWLKDRLESKNQTVTKQKWEGGRYQAFLKDKKIEQRSKYDKLDPDVLGHYLERPFQFRSATSAYILSNN